MRPKILFIINNFAAQTSPASAIEQELVSGLNSQVGDATVICSSLGGTIVPHNIRVIKVHHNKLIVWLFALIRKVFPDVTWIPDSYYLSWGWRAFLKAQKIIERDKIDVIHSFGFPNTDHVIGLKLKKKYGIPWIATFLDSWTDYPSRKFITCFFRSIDERLERKVACNADVIVHTSQSIVNIWNVRYGAIISKKMKVVPINVAFNKESRAPLNENNKDVLNITHIGTFYKYRDASTFIKIIHDFCISYPLLKKRLRVNFIGNVLDTDVSLIECFHLSSIFNLTGRLSPQDCQRYYRDADILLATAGYEGEDVMFPSKIAKYFYYDKPILCISPHGTIVELEILTAGHKSFLSTDIEGVEDYLIKALDDYKSLCDFDHSYWEKFSIESVLPIYCQLYQQLTTASHSKC